MTPVRLRILGEGAQAVASLSTDSSSKVQGGVFECHEESDEIVTVLQCASSRTARRKEEGGSYMCPGREQRWQQVHGGGKRRLELLRQTARVVVGRSTEPNHGNDQY